MPKALSRLNGQCVVQIVTQSIWQNHITLTSFLLHKLYMKTNSRSLINIPFTYFCACATANALSKCPLNIKRSMAPDRMVNVPDKK